jgi:heme/copper-type cytochrome/quinol oxidase subunit 2
MWFRVKVVTPTQYQAWLASYNNPAAASRRQGGGHRDQAADLLDSALQADHEQG